MATLPPYRHFLSNPVAKPPCRMKNAQMYGFFVAADKMRMQAYTDATLNSISNSDISYKVLSEYCLLTFTDIERIASMTPPFSEQGWMQETDIIIWLPILKVNVQDSQVEHLYWYPAFIAVNNIYALINGRETWGYNKYLCDYEMPDSAAAATRFSLSLNCFKTFSKTSQLANHQLLTIEQYAHQQENDVLNDISQFGHLVSHLFSKDYDGVDFDLIKQLLNGFINPQMDQILFKQFPDGQGEQAVYRAIVHSPSKIKKIHSIKLLPNHYKLVLNQLDSFPLADMFGIAIGAQAVHLPFYVAMDFDQLSATTLLSE